VGEVAEGVSGREIKIEQAFAQMMQKKSAEQHLPVHSLATRDFPVFVGMNAAVIFENNPRQLQQVWATLALLKQASERHSTYSREIAFHLHFDSPASFSQFVKNKTGLTPSALQKRLAKIHK